MTPQRSGNFDGPEDPFAGMLDRSSVAQALRDARASLARTTRPETPVDRTLFQSAPGASRPSSKSSDRPRFLRDTFGVDSSGAALGGKGERCPTIREFSGAAEFEHLFNKEPSTSSSSGSRTGSKAMRKSRSGTLGLWSDFADVADAAKQSPTKRSMRVTQSTPTLASLKGVSPLISEAESLGFLASPVALAKGSSCSSSLLPTEESKVAGSAVLPPDAAATARAASLDDELRALEIAVLLSGQESKHSSGAAAASVDVADKLRKVSALTAATAAVHAAGLDVPEAAAAAQYAPRLLRVVLGLMEVEPFGLPFLRLSRCALELLRTDEVFRDVGEKGVRAGYENVSRALFKLSKDATLDNSFRDEGVLDLLLCFVQEHDAAACGSMEAQVFVAGVLKNISGSRENQDYLLEKQLPKTVLQVVEQCSMGKNPGDAELLVQAMALLRNLACPAEGADMLIALGLLPCLLKCSAAFTQHEELQVNISRVVAKLSLTDAAIKAFETDPTFLQKLTNGLRTHISSAPLVLRLTFALGCLVASSEQLRRALVCDCDGEKLLPQLLQRYWDREQHRLEVDKLSVSKSMEAAAIESENVLVKIVRLIAHLAISPDAAPRLAASPAAVAVLLDILDKRHMPESEELVLNAVSAVTNLLFYRTADNMLLQVDQKRHLCSLIRGVLQEAYNVEAMLEAVRALSNLSQDEDARLWLLECQLDEALCILLAHESDELVFYVCGAFVNLASDIACRERLLKKRQLVPQLLKVWRMHAQGPFCSHLPLIVAKVLANLLFEEGAIELLEQAEVRDLRYEFEVASIALADLLRSSSQNNAKEVSGACAKQLASQAELSSVIADLLDALPTSQDEIE